MRAIISLLLVSMIHKYEEYSTFMIKIIKAVFFYNFTQQYLTAKLADPAGSEIIVISDGGNNIGDLDASIQNAVDAGVTIHSISVSQAADTRMITMATATGGNHISYLEVGNISIASVFTEILSSGVTSHATDAVSVCKNTNTLMIADQMSGDNHT